MNRYTPDPRQERPAPAAESNGYHSAHAHLLCASYRHWTGKDLIPAGATPEETARALYEAPMVVVSHGNEPDPVFNYANLLAQQRFEMDWEGFVRLPSRYSAEAPSRENRARLLERVSREGFIDDYEGIRISAGSKRFRIELVTVWNLIDAQGNHCGQAAAFSKWVDLDE